MLLEGIFLPLTTPFYPDGRVYLHKLQSNVERYSRTPAQGFWVLGEAGEADSLTDAETRSVLQTAIAAAAHEKVMIAAVGRESVAATLELAQVAAETGYDAIALRPPSFAAAPSMRTELMTYFRAVSDAVSIPVLVVTSANRPVAIEALAELAQHPQIVGVLDADATIDRVISLRELTSGVIREATVTTVFAAATRRMLRAATTASSASLGGVAVLEARPALKTRSKRVGFQILSGSTSRMLEAWQIGASGAVPRLGAAAPQACCEVWQAFKDGDQPLAEEKQERVRSVAARLEGLAGIGAVKYGCDFNGYFGGRPRLPLLGVTAAQAVEIERELAGMRN
jgi:dihydrodipicolinate synthase/N-acetylneuraminate lyase